jgi:hypothetical protein
MSKLELIVHSARVTMLNRQSLQTIAAPATLFNIDGDYGATGIATQPIEPATKD